VAGPRRLVLAAILGATIGAQAWAAPVSTNTALPVAEGAFVFREIFAVERSARDPSGLDRDLLAWSSTSVLGYGVSGRLALFGVVPYANRRLRVNLPGGRARQRAGGLRDIRLFGRYTLYKMDRPGRTLRIAPLLGLEFPTGDNRRRDALGLLPPGVQPGSGSWDPFFGVIATYQTLDFQLDSQLGYQVNTRADGLEIGDVLRFDASFQYRLWPRKLTGGTPGFLYGVLETNLIHQGRNRVGGIADPNSGGTRLYLVPGLQYVTKRWILEAAVRLPVYQDLNGTALKSNYTVLVGFRVNF
jgi:hypothetical protein